MLTNASIIMVIGMTVVFFFLLIMIGLMNFISFVFKFFPEKEVTLPVTTVSGSSSELEEIAVVIAIAKEKV